MFPTDEELTALFDKLSDANAGRRHEHRRGGTQSWSRRLAVRDRGDQAYQEALRLDPAAGAKPTSSARRALRRTRERLAASGITSAMGYLERATTANVSNAKVVVVRDKIQQAASAQQEIQTMLQQASVDCSALINHGANAAEIYHRVLATDPHNAIANQGLSEVVANCTCDQLLRLVRSTPFARSMRVLPTGLADTPMHELKAKLGAEEQRIGDHTLARRRDNCWLTASSGAADQNAVARVARGTPIGRAISPRATW